MVQWYQHNHRLFREERAALADKCPLMQLIVAKPGFKINNELALKIEYAVAYGTYELKVPGMSQAIDYKISIVFPEKYPNDPPHMFCNDPKLPVHNIDRHIMRDGEACLGVCAEIRQKWPKGSSIVGFIDNIIEPFLAWQAYYDASQEVPPWGQRSHGTKGILEYYAEVVGLPVEAPITNFMKLLARKNAPEGHEPCPCGSGKKLRHCHRELINKARQVVSLKDAAADLRKIKDANSQTPLLKSPA